MFPVDDKFVFALNAAYVVEVSAIAVTSKATIIVNFRFSIPNIVNFTYIKS
jgi:hypothetical protein